MAKRKTKTKNPKNIKCDCCCQHCKYRWEYGGKSRFYMTCPRCYYKVRAGK